MLVTAVSGWSKRGWVRGFVLYCVSGAACAAWLVRDVELMAQHQDLDLLRVPAAKAEQNQLNHSAEREIDERPDQALQTSGIDREQRG
jgi:hypothetical protein